MSEYKIVVQRYEKNPNYEAEMEQYKEHTRRSSYQFVPEIAMPQESTARKVLDTILTEAEFQAVRKACLEAI